MDYKNLYLKYKTKYINLKEQSGGTPKINGIDDYITYFIRHIYLDIAIKAKTNVTSVIESPKDKLVLSKISFTYDIVYPFIFRYLLEYGFSINELNIWINKKNSLHNIINILYRLNRITNISNIRQYINNLVEIGINDPKDNNLFLLIMFIFENNILLNSGEIKIFLKYLNNIIMRNRDIYLQFTTFMSENKTCAKFIVNNILNNPQITLKQLMKTNFM